MPTSEFQPVVTLSASYGAGGSVVAPALAERLGLPLVGRLLTREVADAAASSDASANTGAVGGGSVGGGSLGGGSETSDEGHDHLARAASPSARFFAHLARAANASTLGGGAVALDEPDTDLRAAAEADLVPIRSGAGAVVLGRAGAVVLADRPRCFHVRLDGPASRRIAVACRIEDINPDDAAERQARTDRSRLLWVKRLYRADAADPAWYHLWLDTTVLDLDAVTDIVATSFERYLAAA